MYCKYLHQYHPGTTRQVISCGARYRLYLPSLAELENFCLGGDHEVCPVFRAPFAREEDVTLIACWSYPFQEPRRTTPASKVEG